MSKADRELETLRSAIEEAGVVVRLREVGGNALVELYWILPKVEPKLRHFTSAVPLALIRDFRGNGFRPHPGDARELFDEGVFSTAMISDAKKALEIARSIVSDHALEPAGDAIQWTDK